MPPLLCLRTGSYLHDLDAAGGWEGLDQKAGRKRFEKLRTTLSRKHKITPPVRFM
jgi:hypothetical protein